METLKQPVWRVPVILTATGLLCEILSFIGGMIQGRLSVAKGPDPETGAYIISSGYVTEIVAVISFFLFWAAGWLFVRKLSRRQIFRSATIVAIWHIAALAIEQFSQRVLGTYPLALLLLFLPSRACDWVTQLLIHLVNQNPIPFVVFLPAILTPYLYVFLGKKVSAAEANFP